MISISRIISLHIKNHLVEKTWLEGKIWNKRSKNWLAHTNNPFTCLLLTTPSSFIIHLYWNIFHWDDTLWSCALNKKFFSEKTCLLRHNLSVISASHTRWLSKLFFLINLWEKSLAYDYSSHPTHQTIKHGSSLVIMRLLASLQESDLAAV